MQNFFIDAPLTVRQLDRLKDHKYSSQGTTALDSELQPFWNALVDKIPIWDRWVKISFEN